MASKKYNFIKTLLLIAVVLLITDIIIDRIQKPAKSENVVHPSELSVQKIEDTFFIVLNEYGIEKNWIKIKKVKPGEEDSVKIQILVNLPSDVPIPLVIRDINKIIEKDITGFVCEEKKIFGSTEIRVYANEILKLKAVLTPDKSIIRNRNSLSFVLSDAFDLSGENFNNFLSLIYPASCLVVPDGTAAVKADTLKNYRKEYTLLLNDDISDSKMKLKQGFQNEILRGSIKNILFAFKDAKILAVDEKSNIFNSPAYKFIRDDFQRQGINVIKLSEMIYLNGNDDADLLTRFNKIADDSTGQRQKVFITTFENFQKLVPALERCKKRGDKIISVSKTYLAQNKK